MYFKTQPQIIQRENEMILRFPIYFFCMEKQVLAVLSHVI